ncbi:MAG: TonB-dependent receptor [Bacteroidales bacterium]|nr:TonB-dependent receptor [Bacteroidales bacterium]MBR3541811.1 TonB-dependent receptor [Bacteroidales bacterium]
MSRITLLLAILLFSPLGLFAQTMVVNGVVVDEMGEPVIGANAYVKGTTIGAITDIDGNFSLTGVPVGATIGFSFVGYIPQELPARVKMNVVLVEDKKLLEDVVVVGYGVQKKSVVTAAIAKVSSEDLEGKAPVRIDNALKGLAAGVNVTANSGQPGESSRVRVRGTGSYNASDPLYIVDGIPLEGGLDIVNPNDIESIEVLKDAASGAIYGARAANGVIIVTTKKGKQGKAQINYNASWGWQTAWKHRDVTNATEYAVLQNEKYVNAGMDPLYADPYNLTDAMGNAIPLNGGTDWQSLVFNDNAPIVNHDVSVSGANDRMNYYVSLGYFSQEGIVGGNYGQSNYDRLTLRSNSNYTLIDATKERNFLNKLDLSVNLSYLRTHSTGISTNSEFGSVLGSALYMSPILTPTVSGAYAEKMRSNYSEFDLPADENGNLYSIPNYGGTYQEMNNPLAMMVAQTPTKNWSHKFVPHFNVTLGLWDNLKYSFSYSADLSFWGYDGAVKSLYYLSGNNNTDHTSATQFSAKSDHWQIENVISYDKELGRHSFNIVLGQSAYKSKGAEIGGSRWNLVNINKPSINYATGNVEFSKDADGNITGATVEHSVWGGPYTEHTLSSLFARGSYNYDERYMFQFTLRRDGSSRFGSNNKYGVFPSFSLGWNFVREPFFNMPEWVTIGKLRYSWGKNGYENIGDFTYTTLTSMGNNVLFGRIATKQNGSKANRIANPDLKWEESEQHDLGIDLGFMKDALTLSVDYFIKKTNGMILAMPIPSYVGETKPLGNVGDMENKGVEIELGWKGHISDFHYSLKGNVSYVKNTLKNLGNTEGFLNFDGIQGIAGGGTRAENGQPFPFFYGYKTDGVFQNMDEVRAYTNADGQLIQPKAVPGDVRFVDVNGDGQITTDDRTNIGNGTPDWTFGFNANADWKGFDFNIFLQGVQGSDVFDATYRSDVFSGNYPKWMLNRWTGEGTSDKYPRLSLQDETNWQVSDLYVCDGSYLRIKNMSLGYTLPAKLTRRAFIERFRIYGMVENLVTWTKYWGFDPEIASGGTSLGIDRGVYPQARTWTVGFNIAF